MPVPESSPRRLVFGPAEYAGYEGIVLDAESARRLPELASRKTLAEAVPIMYKVTWDEYVASELADGAAAPAADEESDLEEWLLEGRLVTPQETACEIAGSVVHALLQSDPDSFPDVRVGGASPGGNSDLIAGPLAQLELLASRINAADHGFVLERDDALVDAGMARHLYP